MSLPDLPAPSLTWRKPDLRFAVGDTATLAQPAGRHSQAWAGVTVCISEVAVTENDPRLLARHMVAPAARDYLIRYPDGSMGLVDDWQLEPLPPTPEPTR